MNPYNPDRDTTLLAAMSGDFRRPPPPPPPPLEDWLLRRDRADGYREPFFAGREAEFGAFQEAARGLEKGFVGGETLVFQGAPGAGKSALMKECAAAVEARSTLDDVWVGVAVLPSVLEYPAGTVEKIALAVERERERLAAAESRMDGPLERARQRALGTIQGVTERGAGIMGVRVGARAPSGRIDVQAAFRRIENVCRGARAVLFVDEAQNLPEGVMEVLDALHRGQAGIALLPVLLGLGDTAAVLAKRGISRPPAKRLVEMSALRPEEARESLSMVFDAYGVHGRAREGWLQALAETCQGWPQHLNRVAVAAGEVLHEHGMNADAAPLAEALAAGEAAKTEYYRDRLRDVPGVRKSMYKRVALLLDGGRSDDSLAEEDLEAVLRAAGVDPAGDGYARWLTESIHCGLLAPAPDSSERYRVPIPSLASYLRGLRVTPSPAPRTRSSSGGGGPSPR